MDRNAEKRSVIAPVNDFRFWGLRISGEGFYDEGHYSAGSFSQTIVPGYGADYEGPARCRVPGMDRTIRPLVCGTRLGIDEG